MINYKRLTNPADLPVSLLDAFRHLRLIVTDAEIANIDATEQAYVTGLIKAAAKYCESYTRRQLMPATFEGYLDKYPQNGWLYLQKSPVLVVSKIETRNAAGEWVELDKANYEADVTGEPARVKLKNALPQLFFDFSNIKITFSAGYGTVGTDGTLTASVDTIPETIKSAIKLIVGHLYEHREEVVMGVTTAQMPFGVDTLLDTERLFIF